MLHVTFTGGPGGKEKIEKKKQNYVCKSADTERNVTL